MHVVTSDGAEQSVILGAGAYRLPAMELWRRIQKFREKLKKEYLPSARQRVERNEILTRIDKGVAAQLDKLRRREK